MEHIIGKSDLTSITANTETNEVSINWWTGGKENAVCGIKFKVTDIQEVVSLYKSPHIEHDPDHDRAF